MRCPIVFLSPPQRPSALLSGRIAHGCEDFLSGDFSELLDIRVAGGEQSGEDAAAIGGDLVAVSAGHLFDLAVGAQESQFPCHCGGPAALDLAAGALLVEQCAEVAIAYSLENKLPAA